MNQTLPEAIQQKLDALNSEIEKIVAGSEAHLISWSQRVSFKIQNSALNQDILTDSERSQLMTFIMKYESIPDFKPVVAQSNGQFHLSNIGLAVHVLNEFRPILQNNDDSVFYSKLHTFFLNKLNLKDPTVGTTISVWIEKNEDVTDAYIQFINGQYKAIKYVLKNLELKYLYNGFLQHSDEEYFERFSEDWHTGKINYVLIKHAHLLSYIKALMKPYYLCFKHGFAPYFQLGPL